MKALSPRRAETVLPEWLLQLHRHTRSSLLVLGGTPADRRAVVESLHSVSPVEPERLRTVHCGLEEEFLAKALQTWLAASPGTADPNPMGVCEHGTLHLEEVRRLSEPSQRLLLALAVRMQGAAGTPHKGGPFRLAAGDTDQLLVAVRERRFSRALFDFLDKIRIDLRWSAGRGAA